MPRKVEETYILVGTSLALPPARTFRQNGELQTYSPRAPGRLVVLDKRRNSCIFFSVEFTEMLENCKKEGDGILKA